MSDLVQELDKVWEVIAEELCANDDAFAGVVGEERGTEKLGLSDDTKSGSLVGILEQRTSQLLCKGGARTGSRIVFVP